MSERTPALDAGEPAGTAGLDPRTFWTLLVGNALTMIGIGFFLPILPLVVASRGGSAALVGAIFAAGVIARTVAQYPAGWLADRVGRRPLIVGSLLLYALLFPLYVLHLPVLALIGLRFVHSLAASGYEPAAMALVADLTHEKHRGRAYSRLRASDMVGILIGPALGGAVAGLRLDYVFYAGAIVCLVAAVFLLRLPKTGPPTPAARAAAAAEPTVGLARLLRLLLPVILLGIPIGWVFGTYDTIWSLYLTSRGASTFLVGLSFATYALPIVVFAGFAAGLADRLGSFRAGTLAVITYGLLAATYPFIASVPALILVGLLEGALTAAGNPALNAETSRVAPPGAQGRTQGAFGAALNLAQVLGALAGGALYGLGPKPPFLVSTGVCLLGAGASLVVRRSRREPAPSPA
ncbi:MAG: MFS transporter [Candidatus Dormibacteraeota bacterium]|nr:MFS transporter [Candidatus Dormibacteraeota bacterium]